VRKDVLIPAGAEVVVVDTIPVDPTDPKRKVNVEWDGRSVTILAIDICEQGEEI
jgi:hypothetical protein